MIKKIFVIAGEASGDLHGANLIAGLKSLSKELLEIYGVGGDKIKETGALEFFDLAHFHVTGLTDALKRLPQYKQASKTILASIRRSRPDLVVLIDNPGFNLHLAKEIHALKIPIVYYIAPQLWAWAPKRIEKIKAYVTKVLVVFEFEKKIYEDHGIPVAWVGHPLKDLIEDTGTAKHLKEARSEGKPHPRVSLLPGSRKGELKMLLPILLKAAKRIQIKIPLASFSILKSPTLTKDVYERLMKKESVVFPLIEKNSYGHLRESDLAIACSGTATLECALLETPMIIVNKGTWLTYVAVKSVIKVPYIGLPNLVLQENRIPELLQYDATPEKISKKAVQILTDRAVRSEMIKDLREVSKRVGEKGANRRAAEEVLRLL